ncbi:pre-mRNA-processing factor 19 [Vigna unguiculata]|uniref:Pre-mRNA-processing factor 19 n=1 Tax=Vigna unguiculata TaxID=3917 RepID=A0A4D6L2Z5_VIGUN|nr:pre-mRNA-processing factor 19 [Vigna unguiculata]
MPSRSSQITNINPSFAIDDTRLRLHKSVHISPKTNSSTPVAFVTCSKPSSLPFLLTSACSDQFPLDAIVITIQVLEDDSFMNTSIGSNLANDGGREFEAIVMEKNGDFRVVEHDVACRVVARIKNERDEARCLLAQVERKILVFALNASTTNAYVLRNDAEDEDLAPSAKKIHSRISSSIIYELSDCNVVISQQRKKRAM